MPNPNGRNRLSAEDLECRYALGVTIDEGMADQLGIMAMHLREQGHLEQAKEVLDASRRHRVGAIKFRALMSALIVEQG